MDFRFERQEHGALVALSGRLTFDENAAFRRIVEQLDGASGDEVVFDLAGMDTIDSAGLGMLMVARDAAAAHGATARIVHAEGRVARMLRLARFDDFFTLGNAQS